MAFNFGTNISPDNNTSGITGIPGFPGIGNGLTFPQPSGIQVIPASSRQIAEDYPLSAGTTGFFFNYNGRRVYIKTQNKNGLSYDMEELIILTPQEFQQMQQAALVAQTHSQQPIAVNSASSVSVDDFNALVSKVDSLYKQFEEFIK